MQDNPSEEKGPNRELVDSNKGSNWKCRPDVADVDCSGRGACECGRCVCDGSKLGAVFGKYCEIDDFSCPYHEGRLCGGEGGHRNCLFTKISSLTRPHPSFICSSQGKVCVCPANVSAWMAGQVRAAVAPSPRQPVNRPMVCYVAAAANACVGGAYVTTLTTLEIPARSARRAKAPVNHTGTCFSSEPQSMMGLFVDTLWYELRTKHSLPLSLSGSVWIATCHMVWLQKRQDIATAHASHWWVTWTILQVYEQ